MQVAHRLRFWTTLHVHVLRPERFDRTHPRSKATAPAEQYWFTMEAWKPFDGMSLAQLLLVQSDHEQL